MRILICEDNPMAMKTLSVILEREGFEADLAEDGNVAIDLLQMYDYDLLVVDIHLPYRSGLELVKFVRSDQGKDTLLRGGPLCSTRAAEPADFPRA